MIVGLVLAFALFGPSLIEGCGVKPLASRVINGVDAKQHSWPWQISLRVSGRHICGGSLIKPDWVLTAAHCVASNPKPSGYTVVVGAHTLSGTTAVQETLQLKQLVKHKKYSNRNLKNDVALLQLERPVKLSAEVSPVCLPSAHATVGKDCYITGWGRDVAGGNLPDTLQQAALPVRAHQDCASVNGHMLPVDETTMLCAGGQGKGGCQGDSGGPFVCNEGGKWVLHGAVSWGHHQCDTNYYTVFARINSFIQWINNNIAGGSTGGGGNGGNGGGGGKPGGGGGKPNALCADLLSDACSYLTDHCSSRFIRNYCKKSCKACF